MSLEDDHIRWKKEREAKAVIAELAIKWVRLTMEANRRETVRESHGGPLRKQASDLEQGMINVVLLNNLYPKPEVVDNGSKAVGPEKG